MYKVLYRKYRPSNFDEVLGQKNTVALLKDSVMDNKISHAYMFSGPRGTGKTSTAKILAKTLNCLNPQNGNPCCKCDKCLNFNSNQDIYEIDAASNNGVDQIREIIDNIKLLPINSNYKVFIIDEVHMLSQSAFNALLLTLEEPPSHVVFILATTNIESVPITILSRCQRLDFRRISNTDIIENLHNIAMKENILINEEALEEISEYSDGGMRDALGLLDQLSKLNTEITPDIVEKNIGILSKKEISELIDALLSSDNNYIVDKIEKYKQLAYDFKTIVKNIVNNLKQRIVNYYNGDSTFIDVSKLKNLCIELANILNFSSVNINQYDLLEIILLNYIIPKTKEKCVNVSKEEQKNQTEYKESKTIITDIDICEEKTSDKINNVDIRINNCFVNANKSFLSDGKNNWNMFLKNLTTKKILGLVEDTNVVLCSDNYIILSTNYKEKAYEFNINQALIENELERIINIKYKVVCIDNLRWNEEMNKYKENMKNKISYKFIEETINKVNNNVVDVFNTDVIEIK